MARVTESSRTRRFVQYSAYAFEHRAQQSALRVCNKRDRWWDEPKQMAELQYDQACRFGLGHMHAGEKRRRVTQQLTGFSTKVELPGSSILELQNWHTMVLVFSLDSSQKSCTCNIQECEMHAAECH